MGFYHHHHLWLTQNQRVMSCHTKMLSPNSTIHINIHKYTSIYTIDINYSTILLYSTKWEFPEMGVPWDTPKWIVYHGNSQSKMVDDWGLRPCFGLVSTSMGESSGLPSWDPGDPQVMVALCPWKITTKLWKIMEHLKQKILDSGKSQET